MAGGRIWLRRRIVAYGAAVAFVAPFVACSADPTAAELGLTVSGVRSGAVAHVVVSGPGGSRVFDRSGTWQVEPGRYTVMIEPVREGDTTLRATEPRLTVDVLEATRTEVRAEYRVKIPDYTKIADAVDSPILAATDTEVTLKDGPYAADLRPGQVIASGAGPGTGEAFAARVESLRPGADGTTIASVTQVPLVFAMPRMVIRFRPAPAPRAYSLPLDSRHRADDIEWFPGPPSVEGERWTETDMGEHCSRTGPTLKYDLKGVGSDLATEFEFDLGGGHIDLNLWPPSADVELPRPKVRLVLGAAISGNANFGIKTGAAFTCEAEKDGTGLDVCKGRPSIDIPGLGKGSGLTCEVSEHYEAAMSSAAAFEFGAGIKFDADLTAEASVGGGRSGVTVRSKHPATVQRVWGQMEPPSAKVKVESDGTFSGGVLTTVGAEVGKGTATMGIEYTNFIHAGAKITLDHLEGVLTAEYRVGAEYGLKMTFAGEDRESKLVPARFTLPVAKWKLRDENKVMRPAPRVDGTIYYTEDAGDGTNMLRLYSKTGDDPAHGLHNITPGAGTALSPDGKRSVWVDYLSNPDSATLSVTDTVGNDSREVTAGENHILCNYPAWAPDSRHVLFQKTSTRASSPGPNNRWALVNVDTGEEKLLDEQTGCYPEWSPDGKAIAWYDQVEAEPTHANIRITDEHGNNSRFVPHIQGIPDPCFNKVLALSPDGKRAVVDASQPDRNACGDGPTRPNAVAGLVVDTATGKAVGSTLPGPIQTAVYLPDGTLLAMLVGSKEFILLDKDLSVIKHLPDRIVGDDVVLLAYSPR